MLVVKSLVKSGITICATIHSPTPFCFNLFDRMMILLGGSVVYSGHNGAPDSPSSACAAVLSGMWLKGYHHATSDAGLPAVHFFEDLNPEVPKYGSFASEKDNPAEWIVDVTTKVRLSRFLSFICYRCPDQTPNLNHILPRLTEMAGSWSSPRNTTRAPWRPPTSFWWKLR